MASGRAGAAILVALTACDSSPVPDTPCSGSLPVGGALAIPERSHAPLPLSELPPLAVGGSLTVRPVCGTAGMWTAPIGLPYEVRTDDERVLRATKVQRGLEVVGISQGTGTILLNGEHVSASHELDVAAAESFVLMTYGPELSSPVDTWAWLPGVHMFFVKPYGAGGDLMGSVSLRFQGQELLPLAPTHSTVGLWNTYELDLATTGTHTLEGRVGDTTALMTFTVVEQVQSISMIDSPGATLDRWARVCFTAHTADGRRLIDAPWSFSAANAELRGMSGNCAYLETTAGQIGQTAELTATVAGESLTVTLDVI